MSILERSKPEPAQKDRSVIIEQEIMGLQKRIDDLKAWQNHWTPEDVQLIKRLEAELAKKEEERLK